MLVLAWTLLDIVRFGFDFICRFRNFQVSLTRSPIRLPILCIAPVPLHCSFKTLSMSFNEYDWCEGIEEALEVNENVITNYAQSKIAYVHNFTRPLIAETYITVKGRTKPGCLRFAVDFQCGIRSMSQGTIAFHFNPRLEEGYVVRNCLLHGTWGEEETSSISPLTLHSDEKFEISFYVTPEEFMVSVNDAHFCGFRHRIAFDRISSMVFVGDVIIYNVELHLSTSYPYFSNHKLLVHKVPIDVEYDEENKINFPMPYTGEFIHPLESGTNIEIYATVKLLPHSFYINLQNGINLYPHPRIPLHLNPRFSASCGSNSFVRNSWIIGKWQKEERSPVFPFSPGYPFTMTIRLEDQEYIVWVNNQLIAEYTNREIAVSKPTAIYIQGDIYLHHVFVNTKGRSSFNIFK